MSALTATRPTFLASPALAIPCTTVQKMIGATSIRTSLMKRSPRGFSESAAPGHTVPTMTPSVIASKISRERCVYQGRGRRGVPTRLTCATSSFAAGVGMWV